MSYQRIPLLFYILFALLFQSCSAQKKETHLLEDELETISIEKLHYYLYFPEDYELKETEDFPLLLFLHGGGDTGNTLSKLQSSGPPKLIKDGKQFPFLILAPQHPYPKQWWNTRAVKQLLDSVVNTHRVDKKRIYLTGLSRGGGAAWEMAVHYPETFAAMAVVCGMAPLPYASWINKEMPIWVFHGAKDQSVPVSESDNMVKKLKEMGRPVQYTRYKDVGHNSWEKAYTTEELYEWFIQQQKEK